MRKLRGRPKVIGYEVSEVLDVKPAEYFVASDQARETRLQKV
jgi:hypothetical protein